MLNLTNIQNSLLFEMVLRPHPHEARAFPFLSFLMKVFLVLHLCMGLVEKAEIQYYWEDILANLHTRVWQSNV